MPKPSAPTTSRLARPSNPLRLTKMTGCRHRSGPGRAFRGALLVLVWMLACVAAIKYVLSLA
ncbi:MAG TPA: hypothetical protein VGV13_12930 [Methylomirabilota bacterium]|jgi:hypothetical protein|nr:hypothetical protein [Methylomirabilota bacterium]